MSEITSIVGDTARPAKGSTRLWDVCRAAERTEIARALVEHAHNRTHAAVALGISRRTLLNKIKQYGLTRLVCRQLSGDLPPPSVLYAAAAGQN